MKVLNINENHRLGSPGTSQNTLARVQNTFRCTLSPNALGQESRESWNLAWCFFSCSQIYAFWDIINRWKPGVDEYNSRLCARGIWSEWSDCASRIFLAKCRFQIRAFPWCFFSCSQTYAFWDIINRWKSGVDEYNSRLCARGILSEPNPWTLSPFWVQLPNPHQQNSVQGWLEIPRIRE